jgi:GH24 family phage-related lysozyme (muramidase)
MERQSPASLKPSSSLKELSTDFEGDLLYAYDDADTSRPRKRIKPGDEVRGVLTIGKGHTRHVYPGQTCTQEESDRWHEEDLQGAATLAQHVIRVPVYQHEFDAFVSILNNVGPGRLPGSNGPKDLGRAGIVTLKNGQPSTLLRELNAGNYDVAATWFTAWKATAGAEYGLYRRRLAEMLLFMGLPWKRALNACRSLAFPLSEAIRLGREEAEDIAVLNPPPKPGATVTIIDDILPATIPTPAPIIDLPAFETEPEAETVVVASAAAESVESVSSAPLPTQPEAAKPAPAPVPDSPPAIQATTVTVQPIAGPPVTLAPNIAPSIVNTPLGPVSSDGKDWYRSQTVMGGILQAGARIVGRVKVGTAVPGALAALAVNDPVVQALAVTIIMIAVVYCVEHWGEWTAHRGRKKADHNQPLRRA